MTIAALLISLENYLRPLVAAQGGVVSVVETIDDVLEMLEGDAPTGWRVILSADGEKASEDFNRAGNVVAEITAYLQVNKNAFEVQPRKSLHREASDGTPSFLTRLHWLVRKLRAVSWDHDEIDQEGLNYRGWEWFKVADIPAWRTAKLSFELLFILDDPATELPSPEPLAVDGTPALSIVGGYLHVTLAGQTLRVRLLDLEDA